MLPDRSQPSHDSRRELGAVRRDLQHAALDVARLVPLHGGTWRAVEMTGTYQSITARYALAHELPTCDDRPAPRTGVTRGEAA